MKQAITKEQIKFIRIENGYDPDDPCVGMEIEENKYKLWYYISEHARDLFELRRIDVSFSKYASIIWQCVEAVCDGIERNFENSEKYRFMMPITEIITGREYAVYEGEGGYSNTDITHDEDLYEFISETKTTIGELPDYIQDTIKHVNFGEKLDLSEEVVVYETRMGSGEYVTWYVPDSWI